MNLLLTAAATVAALLASVPALAEGAEPSDPATMDAPLPTPPPPPAGVIRHDATSPNLVGHHRTPAEVPERTRWYGWQTLLADGASVALFIGGAGAEGGELVLVGVGGLLLAAPIVHFSHRNVGRGLLSLGARVTFPITGAVVGAATADCDSRSDSMDLCPLGAVLLGGLVGVVTAVIVDASVLANEPDPEPEQGVRLTPGVALGSRSGSLVLNGRF